MNTAEKVFSVISYSGLEHCIYVFAESIHEADNLIKRMVCKSYCIEEIGPAANPIAKSRYWVDHRNATNPNGLVTFQQS